MHLKTLTLKSFRNIHNQTLEFNPEFNFIFGKNAQGKTNLIEAIYYLAELKSFRTTNRQDLIQKDAAFANVQGLFEKDSMSWDLSVLLTENERRVLLNQKKPKSRNHYYGLIPLILFEPRHIYLFRDRPSQRRQYLNRALYIQHVQNLNLFRDYDKVVAQKNRLLKEGRNLDSLEVWNEQQAYLGGQIIYKRLEWLQDVRKYLASEYRAISNTTEVLALHYKSSLDMVNESEGELLAQDTIVEGLRAKLATVFSEEMMRRESIIGPHRDDFLAYIGSRHLGHYGSQGENRSAVIALKLSQLKMFTDKHNKAPLFLLDDVASELDEERCRYLFSYLKSESTQVFLTTTDSTLHVANFAGHATSFFVEKGTVSAATKQL
ncbi:MAG: DNA replication/repair protein RecF [bacterium]